MITLIAAASKNNVIGKRDSLPWQLFNDLILKRFKTLTSGQYIIMGRKTFEIFPTPLPNRTHVIITRQTDYQEPECIVVNSLKDAIKQIPSDKDAYIIGGGEIYKLSIELADRIELTRVDCVIKGDAFFPDINQDIFTLDSEEHYHKDKSNEYDFSFQTWIRK